MNRGNSLRTLSHGSGYALDRSTTHIADGKDSWPAGFKRMRQSGRVGPLRAKRQFAGEHESFGIQLNAGAAEPRRIGVGSDEQEQVAQWFAAYRPRFSMA